YPFLNNFLYTYRKLDEKLEKYYDLYTFYKTVVKDDPEINQTYKDILLKLLRNLQNFEYYKYKISQLDEFCTYLYHWLYFNTKEYDHTEYLISLIFSHFQAKRNPINLYVCPYNLYDKHKYVLQSNDLVKLSYFKFSFDDIKNILNERKHPNYCLCQKYLDECVNTYISMNASHCSIATVENNRELCSELRQFNSYYSYLTKDLKIGGNIPDIYTGKRNVELLDCSPKEISELISNTDDSSNDAASQVVSYVKALPTAVGTIAGATSILALLYKVYTKMILNVLTI
ncbi:hypothetical protein PCYB_003810, partial [Plasmodium cynomolgi strain B]